MFFATFFIAKSTRPIYEIFAFRADISLRLAGASSLAAFLPFARGNLPR